MVEAAVRLEAASTRATLMLRVLLFLTVLVATAGLRVPPPSMMGRAEKRAAAKSAKKKGGARGSAASIRKNALPRNVQPADAPRADGGEWLNPKPATEPGTRRVDVDLGRGKSVVVMLPVLEGEVDGAALEPSPQPRYLAEPPRVARPAEAPSMNLLVFL